MDVPLVRHNFYILTGGPGAGKTTIIEELKSRGYQCAQESGRLIIQEQIASGGDALPWGNKVKFRDKMLAHEMAAYETTYEKDKPIFFDRGVPDLIGYSNLEHLGISEPLISAVRRYRYNPIVFIAPPWEEIYCNDIERKQTFEEAVATYEVLNKAYMENGYELIELPKVSVKERIQFILSKTSNV